VIAALATAILIGALRADPADSQGGKSSGDMQVILANTPLPAMSVITLRDIIEKAVPKNTLPEGYFTNSVQAVGKVLAVSVVEGQVLTKSCFVTEGSLSQLAAAIPPGMRAMSVMLSNRAITGGLLYPGCVVDILASFKLPSRDSSKGQAVSATLLQGIQVLAVENVSVVSSEKDKKAYMDSKNKSGKKLMVTLMVTPRQAEALQLAREYGSVSVSMRNPLDRFPIDEDTTVLSEGQLARFGSVLTPSVLTSKQKRDLLEKTRRPEKEYKKEYKNSDFAGKQAPQWGVMVIRGQDVRIHQLDIPRK
jgi:pilus assembly protein CpaB